MTDPTRSYNTDYPSIPSVAGSAKKNTQPIIDALRPYVERSLTSAVPDERAATGPQGSGPQGSGSKEDSTARPLETRRGNRSRPKIIELASGTGEHLAAYAIEWTGVDWVGSERSPSTSAPSSCTSTSSPTTPLQDICKTLASNVLPPVQLDVLRDADWEEVRGRYGRGRDRDYGRAGGKVGVEDGDGSEKEKVEEAEKEDTEEAEKEEREQEVKMGEDGGFDGMIINNLLHCAPFPTTPSSIFRHASTLLKPGGWISLYGAFRGDDGGFGSEGDRKFHERFISLDPAFGLRTIPSIQRIAEEHGWQLVQRKGMMSGNWMVFFERSM